MSRGKNKDHICECGTELLYRKGFNATGIQEIADAANVPKGSFYNYFKSKEDFGVEAINRYTDTACDYIEQTLIKSPLSPLNRLKTMYRQWIDNSCTDAPNCGCLIGNLTQELATQNPKIRHAVDRALNRSKVYYTDCIREAQEKGEISTKQEPEVLAEFITNAWQGAMLRAKASGDSEPLNKFFKVVFDQILV